jgi:hypothetical protein
MQAQLRSLFAALLVGTLLFGFTAAVSAVDPSGTWTWSTPGRNGGPAREMTLKLKLDGEKLTGSVTMPGRQGGDPVTTEIAEGKFKNDEVTFTVTREYNGNKMVTKYSGKVTAESIKGKIESERQGQPTSRDWEAKKAVKKDAK